MGKKVFTEADRRRNIAKANKKGGIPKKFSLVIYAVILLLAVAARTHQLYTNMDFSRGRYIDPTAFNLPVAIIVIGIILLLFVLLGGSAKDKVTGSCILLNPMRLRYDRLNKRIPHAAGYCSLLMAFLTAMQIVLDFVNLVHKNNEIIKTLTEDEAEDYSKLTGYTVGQFVMHLLMFFVVLTFVSIALNIFKGEGFSHANCAALSTFSIWKTAEIFIMASENTAMSLSSELVYIMFANMTAVVFFMNTARFFNGMEKKFTRFWMCFTGYMSSILAAVSVIPRYIMLLIPDDYDSRLEMNVPAISDVGVVFMTITIVAVFWSTYVYRVMPKLNTGNRRWSRAPLSRQYTEMETIDNPSDTN